MRRKGGCVLFIFNCYRCKVNVVIIVEQNKSMMNITQVPMIEI